MPIPSSLRTVIALNLSAAALTACGGGGAPAPTPLPAGCERVSKPEPKHVDLPRPTRRVSSGARLTALVDTSCGSFTIALDAAGSPKTVSSFAYLARHRVYDGTSFERIVPGFVVQGGDPSGTGAGGPGYTIVEPPPPDTQYKRTTVAMVKMAAQPPGGSGSQFFVVVATDSGLPPNYAVLGRVTSGWNVVSRIASVGDPASGQTGTPRATVAIRRITVSAR